MKLPITYDGLQLVVTGEYHRGYSATWMDPGEPEHFEVYRVMDRDIDVTYLHDDDWLDKIEALALEAVGDEQDYAREQAAEWKREEQLFGARA
jgi:hypothetical protein